MMKNERILFACFIVLIMLGFPCSCNGHVFTVGGKDGWVLNPSERYDHWAERNRFRVNDTLLFKYPKGSDSVLVVTLDDYASCNTKNPIQTLANGESRFIIDRSGAFFFISGNPSNCNGGQKLLIQVLAVDHPRAPPPNPTKQLPPPPPATATVPPPPGQVAPPPANATGPSSHNSSSASNAPAPAPSSASSVVTRSVRLAFGGVALSMAMFIVRV